MRQGSRRISSLIGLVTKLPPTATIGGAFAAIFWVVCVSMTYLPKWLADSGLDSAGVATVLACAAWLKVPLTLAAGQLSDRSGKPASLLRVIAAVICVLMPLMFFAREYWMLCLLWGLLGALLSTSVPLTDNIAIVAVRSGSAVSYGRMRLWGSISFLLCSLSGGWLIGLGGEQTVVLMMIAGVTLLLIFSLLAPDYRIKPQTGTVKSSGWNAVRELLRLPGFVPTLSIAACIMASHAALYSLATLHWLELGIALPTIGLLWAIGVVAEIAIFYFSPQITARLDSLALLFIAGSIAALRWTLTAFVEELHWLFGLQLLHAITFTFTQLGLISYIQNQVPSIYSATAQTIYDSCAIGLVFGLAMYVCGLLSSTSIASSFLAMAALAATASLACLWQFSSRNMPVRDV